MIMEEGNFIPLFFVSIEKWTFFRSSNGFKGNPTNLTYNPQHLAYCVEHFRNQLVKAQYLFSSLTLSASIGSSTLENIVVKSLSTIDLKQATSNPQDAQNNEDVIEIKK